MKLLYISIELCLSFLWPVYFFSVLGCYPLFLVAYITVKLWWIGSLEAWQWLLAVEGIVVGLSSWDSLKSSSFSAFGWRSMPINCWCCCFITAQIVMDWANGSMAVALSSVVSWSNFTTALSFDSIFFVTCPIFMLICLYQGNQMVMFYCQGQYTN